MRTAEVERLFQRHHLLWFNGVTYADFDETRDCIVLGVLHDSLRSKLRRRLILFGFPDGSVEIIQHGGLEW